MALSLVINLPLRTFKNFTLELSINGLMAYVYSSFIVSFKY